MHSTDNLNDGYLGSGIRITNEIRKYGAENFDRIILEYLPDRPALKARERTLVNEAMLDDPLCINLKFGGQGGWDHVDNSNPSPETLQKMRASAIKRRTSGSEAEKQRDRKAAASLALNHASRTEEQKRATAERKAATLASHSQERKDATNARRAESQRRSWALRKSRHQDR